ncbi:MAG: AAA family ATPase [Pseudomonadota bacterium]
MKISRIVVKNFRCLQNLDVNIPDDLTCIIGENNTGKTALFRALQICLDVSLPGYFRNLVREDIHSSVDVSDPSQVLIGVEFTGFHGKVNEEALVSTWKTGEDRARIFFRFRPKQSVREALASNELAAGDLTLTDYAWEIKGGGNPATDLTEIEWADDEVGQNVRFSDLQSYLVIALPALRDVESEIRNFRQSPLVRLIESFDIDEAEKQGLVNILEAANNEIVGHNAVSDISTVIESRFKSVAGPAFEMDLELGLSAATFEGIVRNLRMLLSDYELSDFEVVRNGLGMNNILYIALLIEYLNRRMEKSDSAGQLILIEEPEAHLHPQLQSSLMTALKEFDAQVILTTHSTQLTSDAEFSNLVSLTRVEEEAIEARTLSDNQLLSSQEKADLERYLDATKSNLLFARKVMLVEGAAELFLIPALMRSVHGVDLEREGISIVAIHGVHFDVYTKLFGENSLPKKCAIVADADLRPSDADDSFDPSEHAPQLVDLRSDHVEIFVGPTTFERELVSAATLPMLIKATVSLGAPRITARLNAGFEALQEGTLNEEAQSALLQELGTSVLNTAKRFGKARFAQVAARYASDSAGMPDYIWNAYNWLSQ